MADSELILVEPQVGGLAYPEELIDVTKAYLLEARPKSKNKRCSNAAIGNTMSAEKLIGRGQIKERDWR